MDMAGGGDMGDGGGGVGNAGDGGSAILLSLRCVQKVAGPDALVPYNPEPTPELRAFSCSSCFF